MRKRKNKSVHFFFESCETNLNWQRVRGTNNENYWKNKYNRLNSDLLELRVLLLKQKVAESQYRETLHDHQDEFNTLQVSLGRTTTLYARYQTDEAKYQKAKIVYDRKQQSIRHDSNVLYTINESVIKDSWQVATAGVSDGTSSLEEGVINIGVKGIIPANILKEHLYYNLPPSSGDNKLIRHRELVNRVEKILKDDGVLNYKLSEKTRNELKVFLIAETQRKADLGWTGRTSEWFNLNIFGKTTGAGKRVLNDAASVGLLGGIVWDFYTKGGDAARSNFANSAKRLQEDPLFNSKTIEEESGATIFGFTELAFMFAGPAKALAKAAAELAEASIKWTGKHLVNGWRIALVEFDKSLGNNVVQMVDTNGGIHRMTVNEFAVKFGDDVVEGFEDGAKAIRNTGGGGSASNLTQPTNDINELYELAEKAKPKFDKTLDELADLTGGKAIKPDLKKRDRALTKIDDDYEGYPQRLTDIVRGTLEFENFGDLERSIVKIEQKFDIVKTKNTFKASENGYGDIKVLVKEKGNPNGVISEIQVHWKPLLDIKKQEDVLYAQIREMADSNPQKTVLEAQSRKMYESLWKQYPDIAKRHPSIWNLFFK